MPLGRELDAAEVAARLKAFHADPARQAPRYLHGLEPLPEGGFVLRFAQGKIPAPLAHSIEEAQRLRRAAEVFVRRVCLAERADHYHVLCAARDAPAETLKENYHLLMALLHPDRQEGAAEPWPEAFAQRVNLAYAALGSEATRREYDQQLRSEHPSRPARPMAAAPKPSEATRDVRFAKSLIAVSLVVAIVVAAGLTIHDDEWSDQSILQASLARLHIDPLPGANRPRYVGAGTPPRGASEAAVAEEPVSFEFLKPLMRLISEEPRPYVPPRMQPIATTEHAQPVAAAFQAPVPSPVAAAPAAPVASPARVAVPAQVPLVVAQAALPVAQAPAVNAPGPSNAAIEDLIVALVSYYEAGDADRIVGLVDSDSIGFFRRNRLRQAYADIVRATRARQLRIDRLAWSTAPGAASARGAAIVRAEYADRAPLEKRVDMEIDIVLRDGKPRVTRLNLFPETP